MKKTFSAIGFALSVYLLISQGLGILLSSAHLRLDREIYNLLAPYETLIRYLIVYAIAVPVFYLMIRGLPDGEDREKRSMKPGRFFGVLVITLGGGYVLNIIGNIINLVISIQGGGSFENLNPVNDLVANMNISTVILVGVIAPVVEELIFRGWILKKSLPYGEKTAVVFSAVTFGLLHGNITQTLYATYIGLILGYVAVKTGGIFFTILLHLIVNSYSSILALLLTSRWITNSIVLLSLVSLVTLAILLATIIGGMILLVKEVKKISFVPPDYVEEIGQRGLKLWLSPGILSFVLLSIGVMALYIFTS